MPKKTNAQRQKLYRERQKLALEILKDLDKLFNIEEYEFYERNPQLKPYWVELIPRRKK